MKRIKLLVSLAVVAAAAAISAVVVFAAGGDPVEPTSSLNHIEEIKANVGDNPFFTILEIVPNAPYEGSIGYYIDGYEPCRTELINKLKNDALYNPDERRVAVQSYFAVLESNGLISNGDSTPLKRRSEDYKEYFPWADNIPNEATSITFSDNDRYDTYVINKKMTEVTDSSGKFQKNDEYGKEANGGSEQIIEKLVYVEDLSTDVANNPGSWYYAAAFREIKLVDILDDLGNVKSEYFGIPFYKLNDALHYEYLSTFKDGENNIPLNTDLYIVDTYGEPWDAPSDSVRYRAMGSSFKAASGGWFKVMDTSYMYVGEGGDCNIGSESGQSKLKYNTIFVELGFENNNWFLKYVFDYTDEEISSGNTLNLFLMSVTASEAELDRFSDASLVILSADVTGEQKGKLTERISDSNSNRNPLIVDMSVSELKTKFCSGQSASFVNDSLMGFLPSANPLVSRDFNKELTGFTAVKDDIDYEVWLREAQGSTKALANPRVSLASCIRYVINFKNKIVENHKDSLRVLDIEPLPVEAVMNGSQSLTKAQVKAWLPSTAGISDDKIEITHTSTAEFIGKIENINEKYDLIYIGASLAGFNTKGSNITDYNDDDMDGLIYSNIGDKYVCSQGNYVMSGMLDRDYSTGQFTISKRKWVRDFLFFGHYEDIASFTYNKLKASSETTGTMRLSGNDITQKKADEIKSFVDNGHPVVIATNLFEDGNLGTVKANSTCSLYDINGWGDMAINLNVTSLQVEGRHPSYTYDVTNYYWQCKKKSGGTWQNLNKSSFSHLISINGSNCKYDVEKQDDETYFRCGVELSVKKNGNPIKTVIVFTTEYRVYYTGSIIRDWHIVNQNNQSSVNISDLTSAYEISPLRVDNSSIIYQTLNEIYTNYNVFSVKSLEESASKNTLLRYINISCPSLSMLSKPTEYDGSGASVKSELENGGSSGLLSYTFTINNPTDPTPTTTHYQCSLYVDLNGDGRYIDDERLSDLTIRDDKGKSVKENELMSGVKYTVSRYLPGSYAGAIPWKLAVNKIDSAERIINGVLAEETGCTYIRPTTKAQIKILQITGNDDEIDLQQAAQRAKNNSVLGSGINDKFATLFRQISDVYDIEVTSKTVNTFNTEVKNNKASAVNDMNSYNMLILGFEDSYGSLSEAVGNLVLDYIETGKAVLFTHDTTSFLNVPCTYVKDKNADGTTFNYQIKGGSFLKTVLAGADTVPNGWGYTFNSVLRDSLGLDRYGVSSEKTISGVRVGKSKYRFSTNSSGTENRNDNLSGITVSNKYNVSYASKLNELGYSVAYKPNSKKTEVVSETQGFTKYIITRFWKDNNSGKYPTSDKTNGVPNYNVNEAVSTATTVSRVNEGQITRFPFAIDKTVNIAGTHEQYYQVNMNSDDIVVWYCLSGGNCAKNGINDVQNAYYIYNRGNVTYSGAGHSSALTTQERKLFVNTMVAAYRAGRAESTVEFSDRSLFIPVDDVLETEGESAEDGYLSTDLKINFSVKNLNAGAGSKNDENVTFYYTSDDGTDTNFVIDGTPEAKKVKKLGSPVKYSPNKTYSLEVQGALLEALKNFAASDKTEFSIIVQLDSGSADKLEIRKLSLLDIS